MSSQTDKQTKEQRDKWTDKWIDSRTSIAENVNSSG